MSSTITSDDTPDADALCLLDIHEDGVAHLRLNRPASSNGLSTEMLRALRDALLRAHGDGRVRALLVSAAGRHFCAGGDVHVFRAQGEALPDYIRVATALLQNVAGLLMRLQVPVVTAVQGYAAGGGGMGLVCSSDIVVAGEGAKFLAGATRVAMVPDAGVSVTLTHLVGFRKAMEILLLNPVITAAEALAMGLVNRVVPDADLHATALGIAQQLARGAPAALAATKALLWDGMGRSVDNCMPEENRLQARLSAMADALEGLDAVIESREPVFRGR